MRSIKLIAPALVLAGLAMPALAKDMPDMASMTPKQFVAKAGASDKFEIAEAKLMVASGDPQIRTIATKMIADHTDSTNKVKTAAMQSGIRPTAPMLSDMQMHDLAMLKAAKGKTRDALYVKQQLPAHQDALALMQGYAASGTAPALKQVAGDIAPVVQGHIEMFQSEQSAMPAM